ncbi:hypothetical protein HEQ75_25490, partial [Roseomonas sp. BU-1]|nr:hypothetical protein [Falsiroseomonas selenitidurans]
ARAAWQAALEALADGNAPAAQAALAAVLALAPGDGPALLFQRRLARGEAGLQVDQG